MLLLIGLVPLLSLVGFGLGLAGLFRRDRRRLTAVVGTVLHPLAVLLLVAATFWTYDRLEKQGAEERAAAQALERRGV